MSIKICNKCNKALNKEEDFYRHKFAKDGYDNICKQCIKERRKKRYENIIYEIYCVPTNKYYIGQTIKNLSERVSKHFSDAKRGRQQPMYIDMRKYKRDDFKCKIIKKTDIKSELNSLERSYISKYIKEGKKLYNLESGGKKGNTVSEESKIKMSRSKNVKAFYVLNKNSLTIIDEFQTIVSAQKILKVNSLHLILNKKKGYTKNITCIYKDEYNEVGINELKHRIEKQQNQRKLNTLGKNNAMYGMNGSLNPNSKSAYIIKDGKIIDKTETIKSLQDKYGYTATEICRGKNNHYYKKFNIFIYNDSNLPKCIREAGKEVNYE